MVKIPENYFFFLDFEKLPIIKFTPPICRYLLFLWGGILYFYIISPIQDEMNRNKKKEVEDENSIHGIKEPVSKSGMAKMKQNESKIE